MVRYVLDCGVQQERHFAVYVNAPRVYILMVDKQSFMFLAGRSCVK